MNATGEQPRAILQRIARRVMLERGLLPDFSTEALTELGRIQPPATTSGGQVRDLRDLLWASIDNDDSRDLDQLTVAEAMSGDEVKILVAVADVDAVVKTVRQLTFTPATTPPRSTRLPRSSRCFPRSCPPTSRPSVSMRTGWRLSSKWWSAQTVRPRNPTFTGRMSGTERSWPTTASPHGSKAERRRQPSPPCPGSTRTCGSRTGRRRG